jgi:hypothetical protein
VSYWALEWQLTVSTVNPKDLTVDVKTPTIKLAAIAAGMGA